MTMKIQYQLLGLNPRAVPDRPLDQHLEALSRLLPIDSAHVVLEHQRDVTPPFCVSAALAVPGPDIHAAARDHTLQAAIIKVVRRLEEQIQERKTLQQLRLKHRKKDRADPAKEAAGMRINSPPGGRRLRA